MLEGVDVPASREYRSVVAGKRSSARGRRAPLAGALIAAGRRFYDRGWVLGTSGNFSAVESDRPLSIIITPSGAHKGKLVSADFLVVDGDGRPRRGKAGKPSAETALHLAIVRATKAGAVLHTHSVWGTILSARHRAAGGLAIEGYEMLKGLSGVRSHQHREWIPIVQNDQDMQALAGEVSRLMNRHPSAHAFLLAGHGMYTWGSNVDEAERHVEILEFLLEVAGRSEPTPPARR
jgi:methylthioribulose-1-phosphate dehydratase